MVITRNAYTSIELEQKRLREFLLQYDFFSTKNSWHDTNKRYHCQWKAINNGDDDLHNEKLHTIFGEYLPIFHGSKIIIDCTPAGTQRYPNQESVSIKIIS